MGTGDPAGVVLQYGAVGAIAVALAAFAWWAIRRESKRADRLETQLAEANQRLVEANQRISDRLVEVLTQTRDTLRDVRDDYQRGLSQRREP